MSQSTDDPMVVLLGGGVESTMLVTHFLSSGTRVVPIHVRCGFLWEAAESSHIRRFLEAVQRDSLAPLKEVRHSPADVSADFWALTGIDVPKKGDSSKSIEIPVRNFTLLSTAAATLRRLPRLHLVMGTTADNSYSDGTRSYFDDCEKRLSADVDRPVTILTPLILLHKADVIRRADSIALSSSFSCIEPKDDLHCGECYKCSRRQAAFLEAAVVDPTTYANAIRTRA